MRGVVISARRHACRICGEPCEGYRSGTLRVEDPCASCPIGLWHTWDCRTAPPAPDQSAVRGLGDVVHALAKPIVAGVKAVTRGRVDLGKCEGCKQRRTRFNQAFPFGRRITREAAAEGPPSDRGVTP